MNTEKYNNLISSHLVSPDKFYNNIKYDISLVILTYNPEKEQLFYTLESLLKQKNIKFEIIVSDDGSKNTLYNEIVELIDKFEFNDYKLVDHYKNQGTVRNSYDALKVSEGEYIKMISPGDALINENTISQWLKYVKESGSKWSFGNAIYYIKNGNNRIATSLPASPQCVNCYESKKINTCRWNYVVLNDYVLGASTLCEKSIMLKYTERILDRIIYGEDIYFWIMMFDNITPVYYPENVIYYEYGTGISTSGNSLWTKRLLNDWDNAYELVFNCSDNFDSFQRKMKQACCKQYSNYKYVSRIQKLFKRGFLIYRLKSLFFPRKTPNHF